MAKPTGPLMSLEASGSLGKNLTFSKRKSGQMVRAFHRPKKTITLDQWTQRHIIGLLTAHWQIMTDNEKAVYNDEVKAKNLQMSGFNYFIKLAQADLLTYHGLIGYWSMNQKSGGTLFDNSGNGFDATLYPTYPSNCAQFVDSFSNKYGNAIAFDGIDDFATCALNPLFDLTEELSLECWVKFNGNSSGNYGRVLGKAIHYHFLRPNAATNYITFQIYDSAFAIHGATAFDIGEGWHHVVGTFRYDLPSQQLKFYVDGVKVSYKTTTGLKLWYEATYKFSFATSVAFLNGSIDEARLYNRVLGADEILKHYNLLRQDKQRQNQGKFI